MAQFFSQIWSIYTSLDVPVFGVHMSCADLALGFFVALFSIVVIRWIIK